MATRFLAALPPRFEEGPAEARAGEQPVAPRGAGGHEWLSAGFKRASVVWQGKKIIGGHGPQDESQSHEHALRLPPGVFTPLSERQILKMARNEPLALYVDFSQGYKLAILLVSLALLNPLLACRRASEHLTTALEEEKSYTRHSMEVYRNNPKIFQGDKNVLETWSRADYLALAVARQHMPGTWVATSDKLTFLHQTLQHDPFGVPFCVIQQVDKVIVLTVLGKKAATCSPDLIKGIDLNGIDSGNMHFSGRSDYWVYVLRFPPDKTMPDHQFQ